MNTCDHGKQNCRVPSCIIDEYEMENAALKKRVEELEEEQKDIKHCGLKDWVCDEYNYKCSWCKMKEKLAEAEKALEFYAHGDSGHYEIDGVTKTYPLQRDDGHIARQTLSKIRGENERSE